MQNDLLEKAAIGLILEHASDYERRFEQLDGAIERYENHSNPEILAVLMTIRKSTKALFKLASECKATITDEKTLRLNSTLNELVVANMQLRTFNSLFNDNSELINDICEFQCWFAHAAVILTLDLGGE